MTKKISEWLPNAIGSHDIANHGMLAQDFIQQTGIEDVTWPTHTVAETRRALERDPRGGTINGTPDEVVCYGYEIAEHLAEKYGDAVICKRMRRIFGRGTRFDVAIEALRAKGN